MLPDHMWILSVLPGINVSSGLELWQKHTSVVSTVHCHYMGVSQTNAKNDATARSAARSHTMNVKCKTVFKRCRICRYENCHGGKLGLELSR